MYTGIIPLTENMPGPCAVKPGDVIRSKSGKTIIVEETDFDGRLMLADAITYSGVYNPKAVISVGKLLLITESPAESSPSFASVPLNGTNVGISNFDISNRFGAMTTFKEHVYNIPPFRAEAGLVHLQIP